MQFLDLGLSYGGLELPSPSCMQPAGSYSKLCTLNQVLLPLGHWDNLWKSKPCWDAITIPPPLKPIEERQTLVYTGKGMILLVLPCLTFIWRSNKIQSLCHQVSSEERTTETGGIRHETKKKPCVTNFIDSRIRCDFWIAEGSLSMLSICDRADKKDDAEIALWNKTAWIGHCMTSSKLEH